MSSRNSWRHILLCVFTLSPATILGTCTHKNIQIVHQVFNEIDPTGFLIGNETKEWLAQYLVFRVNGVEIKRGQEIFVDVVDYTITISLSIRPEIFNSKGLNDGSSKIQVAGKLKGVIALMTLAKEFSEKIGVVSSSNAQGLGFFIRVKINPSAGPVNLGAVVVDKLKKWIDNPPRMIISLEEGIELIDC